MKRIVIVSGHFNPLHIGHLRFFKLAKALGDRLLIIVNNDWQQVMKSGKITINETTRLEIIKRVPYVDEALIAIDNTPSVNQTLEMLAYRYPSSHLIFANSGDIITYEQVPEVALCDSLNIEVAFIVDGKFGNSSKIQK